MSDLQDRICLVTGGTAGIGLETARLLTENGADVIIVGRDAEKGEAALTALGDAVKVRFIQADLADLASIGALVDRAGPVDVLVNNAGAFPVAPTVRQDVESFDRVFDTNVRGTYFLVQKIGGGMLQRGRGSIVTVTSLATAKGMPGASVYSATKAALESFTRTWAVEFAPHVRVNAVAPGPTRTDGVLAEWGESIEDVGKATALGRTARAHEIAEAILFAASPRASYLTGALIRIDGGGAIS